MVRKTNLNNRVTSSPAQTKPAPRPRRDRRKLMVQLVAAFLVLAMLLPVLIVFL